MPASEILSRSARNFSLSRFSMLVSVMLSPRWLVVNSFMKTLLLMPSSLSHLSLVYLPVLGKVSRQDNGHASHPWDLLLCWCLPSLLRYLRSLIESLEVKFFGLARSGAWVFVWSRYGQTSNFNVDQYPRYTSHEVKATYLLVKLACGLSCLRENFKFSFSTSSWSSNFTSLLAVSWLNLLTWFSEESRSAATRLPRLLEVSVGMVGGFEMPSCFPFPFV